MWRVYINNDNFHRNNKFQIYKVLNLTNGKKIAILNEKNDFHCRMKIHSEFKNKTMRLTNYN